MVDGTSDSLTVDGVNKFGVESCDGLPCARLCSKRRSALCKALLEATVCPMQGSAFCFCLSTVDGVDDGFDACHGQASPTS